MRKIASTNMPMAHFKQNVCSYYRDQLFKKCSHKDYHQKKAHYDQKYKDIQSNEHSEWKLHEDAIKQLSDKEKEDMFIEVGRWDGLFPFTPFLLGEESVKQMFQQIDNCQ